MYSLSSVRATAVVSAVCGKVDNASFNCHGSVVQLSKAFLLFTVMLPPFSKAELAYFNLFLKEGSCSGHTAMEKH